MSITLLTFVVFITIAGIIGGIIFTLRVQFDHFIHYILGSIVGMGVGIFLFIFIVVLSLLKPYSNIEQKQVYLNNKIPFEINIDIYLFTEENGIIKPIEINEKKVVIIPTKENKPYAEITEYSYSSTPILGKIMPEIYGDRIAIKEATIFLPSNE